MNRIKSNNVQMGGEFIVPPDEPAKNISISHASGKEHEMLLSAQSQAKQIIENAQAEAANLLENAKNEAKEEVAQMAENARKEGFSVGKKQGEDAIKKELEDKIIATNNFAKGCFEVKDAIIKSAHRDMVNLITQIAHKVCSKSLEIDDEVLKAITLKAIHSLKDKESINIIVNPDMAEKIYAISDELKEEIPQLESIKIIEDKSVSPDGTIVESPMSRVDSRISSQISVLTEKLMSEINSADADELIPEINEDDTKEIVEKETNENSEVLTDESENEQIQADNNEIETSEPEIVEADIVEETKSENIQENQENNEFHELNIPQINENSNNSENK